MTGPNIVTVRRVTVPVTPATAQVSKFAPTGLSTTDASRAATILQKNLFCFLNLFLAAKQAHWNVVGPAFMGVHKDVLDPIADMAKDMADETAERVATLGGAPVSTPSAIVAGYSGAEYPLRKADTQTHLAAIDKVMSNLGGELRTAIGLLGDIDVISQNMVLDQGENLEKMQWFVRAHLETGSGELPGAAVTGY